MGFPNLLSWTQRPKHDQASSERRQEPGRHLIKNAYDDLPSMPPPVYKSSCTNRNLPIREKGTKEPLYFNIPNVVKWRPVPPSDTDSLGADSAVDVYSGCSSLRDAESVLSTAPSELSSDTDFTPPQSERGKRSSDSERNSECSYWHDKSRPASEDSQLIISLGTGRALERYRLTSGWLTKPKAFYGVDDIIRKLSVDSNGNYLTFPPTDEYSLFLAQGVTSQALAPTHPNSKQYLTAARILVTISKARFEASHERRDLDKAIDIALKHAKTYRTRLHARSVDALPTLDEMAADLLATRFQYTGSIQDIDQAISCMQAIEMPMKQRGTKSSNVAQALILYNLGVLLYEKFCATDETSELSHAIEKTTQAIARIGPCYGHLPSFLGSLGTMLRDRFDTSGDLADLRQAIAKTRHAIDILDKDTTEDNDEERSSYLKELAVLLEKKEIFSRTPNFTQLAGNSAPESNLATSEAFTSSNLDSPECTRSNSVTTLPNSNLNNCTELSLTNTLHREEAIHLSQRLDATTNSSGRISGASFFAIPSVSIPKDAISDSLLTYMMVRSHSRMHSPTRMPVISPYARVIEQPSMTRLEEISDCDTDEEPSLTESTTPTSSMCSPNYGFEGEAQVHRNTGFVDAVVNQLTGRIGSDILTANHLGFTKHTGSQSATPSAYGGTNTAFGMVLSSSRSSNNRRLVRGSGRPGDDGHDSDGDDENDPPRKRPKRLPPQEPNKQRRLKCPYYQRRPEDYRDYSCRGPGFLGMAKLKDHLKRKHLRPIKCPRCWQEMQSLDERDEHLRQYPCDISAEPPDDRVCRFKLEEWSFKGGEFARAASDEEKWKLLYQKLFSRDTRIPSSYELPGLNTHTEQKFLDIFKEEVLKELDPAVQHVLTKLNEIVDRTRSRLYSEIEPVSHSGSEYATPMCNPVRDGQVTQQYLGNAAPPGTHSVREDRTMPQTPQPWSQPPASAVQSEWIVPPGVYLNRPFSVPSDFGQMHALPMTTTDIQQPAGSRGKQQLTTSFLSPRSFGIVEPVGVLDSGQIVPLDGATNIPPLENVGFFI